MAGTRKAVRGKQKIKAEKKGRPAAKRRALATPMPSDRRVEDVTRGAKNSSTGELRDRVAIAPATNARSDMSDQPSSQNNLATQATATVWPGLQALYLLPLRSLQSWQEAWFRLLPR